MGKSSVIEALSSKWRSLEVGRFPVPNSKAGVHVKQWAFGYRPESYPPSRVFDGLKRDQLEDNVRINAPSDCICDLKRIILLLESSSMR